MMNKRIGKAQWRQLGWLVPLMLGLLLFDTYVKLSPLAHQMLEVGIILLLYGAMACWLWANQAALESEAEEGAGRAQFDWEEGEIVGEMPTLTPANAGGTTQEGLGPPTVVRAGLPQILHNPVYHCAPPSGARLN